MGNVFPSRQGRRRRAEGGKNGWKISLCKLRNLTKPIIIIHIMELTVVIQAGGQSSRMGQNKALMPFLGRPLIERMFNRLAPLAQEILVVTNDPTGLEFLGLPLLPDLVPGKGVLGGLYTAVEAARQPRVAVVACDMPFASPALFSEQLRILDGEGVDVVIPTSGGSAASLGLEPLHAVYRRDTCLPAIRAAIEADRRKLISWFDDVRVRVMEIDEVRHFDPDLRAFLNVNTPEEFAHAESMA
jgi:molybdenum cofactor guanylyltransferase